MNSFRILINSLDSQWENFKLVGLICVVYVGKFVLFCARLLKKRDKGTLKIMESLCSRQRFRHSRGPSELGRGSLHGTQPGAGRGGRCGRLCLRLCVSVCVCVCLSLCVCVCVSPCATLETLVKAVVSLSRTCKILYPKLRLQIARSRSPKP